MADRHRDANSVCNHQVYVGVSSTLRESSGFHKWVPRSLYAKGGFNHLHLKKQMQRREGEGSLEPCKGGGVKSTTDHVASAATLDASKPVAV